MIAAKLPSGIPGLDAITNGGLPIGRTTLITGRSGAGKSIAVLQIATEFVRHKCPVVYVAAEERPSDIVATGDALGFETSRWLGQEGGIHLLDLRRPATGSTVITGEYDPAGLIARLDGLVRETGAKAVVIDSVTALLQPQPPEKVLRAQCAYLVGALEGLDVTVLLTAAAPADYSRPTLLGVEDYVCDLVLILRNVVEGKQRRRSIEVHKYRRSRHLKGEYPLSLTDRGMMVFPPGVDDAPAPAEPPSAQRWESGIPSLDAINGGGWLRESVLLTRGPAGSGKTTLAMLQALEIARRGERVLYYSFQETAEQLLSNLTGLSGDPQLMAGQQNLEVISRHPDATSSEDLLIELRRKFEQAAPFLLVLDGLASLEATSATDAFRLFISSVRALSQQQHVSALLTYATSYRAPSDSQTVTLLDSHADTLIILDYCMRQPELVRSLRLLKMRGSPHDATEHLLKIGVGGLAIHPVAAEP